MPKRDERLERIAECKATVAQIAANLEEIPKIVREMEKRRDAARAEGIRQVFGNRSEAARDHCIVQGLSIEMAEQAAATRGTWRSPDGGAFGIEPPPPKASEPAPAAPSTGA